MRGGRSESVLSAVSTAGLLFGSTYERKLRESVTCDKENNWIRNEV